MSERRCGLCDSPSERGVASGIVLVKEGDIVLVLVKEVWPLC